MLFGKGIMTNTTSHGVLKEQSQFAGTDGGGDDAGTVVRNKANFAWAARDGRGRATPGMEWPLGSSRQTRRPRQKSPSRIPTRVSVRISKIGSAGPDFCRARQTKPIPRMAMHRRWPTRRKPGRPLGQSCKTKPIGPPEQEEAQAGNAWNGIAAGVPHAKQSQFCQSHLKHKCLADKELWSVQPRNGFGKTKPISRAGRPRQFGFARRRGGMAGTVHRTRRRLGGGENSCCMAPAA